MRLDRRQLKRRRDPSDPRCDDCWDARVPRATSLRLCPTCQANAAQIDAKTALKAAQRSS